MKNICVNGTIRPMTAEELAELEALMAEMPAEGEISDAEALQIITGGAT